MKTRPAEIPATDGFALSAVLVEPDDAPRAVVQLHSGSAVRKEFYLKFAGFLADRGYLVVLFDYRGIGGSRPASLRGFRAHMRDWGQRDMAGVLDWIAARHPELPRFIVAHSMGGQLVGLMPNHRRADAIVTIASSTGYWREFRSPYRYYTAFMWYAYIPIATRLAGYVPIKRLGLGEDLPTGVAREWADWCTEPRYLLPFFGRTLEPHFAEIAVPMKAFAVEDDDIATPVTAPKILEYYAGAQIEFERIAPADVGATKIGHFGFFSSRFRDTLWPRPADWLDARLADAGR